MGFLGGRKSIECMITDARILVERGYPVSAGDGVRYVRS
jgi:hypothetical protein